MRLQKIKIFIAFVLLAFVYFETGCFFKDERRDLGYAAVHNDLGRIYRKQGRYEEAVLQFKEAIRINPKAPEAYNDLGIVYYAQGNLQGAIEEYKKAIEIDPDFYKAYNNLGIAYYKQGSIEEAISALKEAI